MASAGSDAAGFVASLLRGTVLREVSMEGWDVLVDMSMFVLWEDIISRVGTDFTFSFRL